MATTKKATTTEFTFQVVLWSDDRKKLLVKKLVKVKRASQSSARDFMIKKYPSPYYFELHSKK